jgi:hypothetical protein
VAEPEAHDGTDAAQPEDPDRQASLDQVLRRAAEAREAEREQDD